MEKKRSVFTVLVCFLLLIWLADGFGQALIEEGVISEKEKIALSEILKRATERELIWGSFIKKVDIYGQGEVIFFNGKIDGEDYIIHIALKKKAKSTKGILLETKENFEKLMEMDDFFIKDTLIDAFPGIFIKPDKI